MNKPSEQRKGNIEEDTQEISRGGGAGGKGSTRLVGKT